MIPNSNGNLRLEDQQTISLRSRSIDIECITGAIWVTWPKGRETVLQGGQQVRIEAAGKICVQALAGSEVNLQSGHRQR